MSEGSKIANWHIFRYDELPSTNDLARRLAEEGLSHAVVLARRQTAGRGRQQRAWLSDCDRGLWFSLICPAGTASGQKNERWPLIIAQSVLEGLKHCAPADYRLKWPNDIILAGRKLAGILTEGVWSGGQLQAVVAGVGINVSQRYDDFPAEIRGRAISLSEWHSHTDIDKEGVLAAILTAANRWLAAVTSDRLWQSLLAEHRGHSLTLSRPVRLYTGGQSVIEGLAVDIDRDGRLEVIANEGRRILVDAGEVTVRIVCAGKEVYV
ncbi:MAG: biotin--[acetyl-CoA-carboxylase] ligase [Negativicutes bacterium]|nr:biotin--[acetyl-CoA-carboxylase] ligase [Negativicutes bacterium]